MSPRNIGRQQQAWEACNPRSLAFHAVAGMTVVVSDDKDAHAISYDPIREICEAMPMPNL